MKRFLALLMVLCLLLTAGCGAAGPEPETREEAAESPGPGRTVLTLSSPTPPTEMEQGYVPEKIPGPDWALDSWGWETCGDSIYRGVFTTDGGIAVAAYDTVNEEWRRCDMDTGEARNPVPCGQTKLSVTGDSIWVLLLEGNTEENVRKGLMLEDQGCYVSRLDLRDGSSSCRRISLAGGDSESSSPEFSGILALDADRALLAAWNTVYLVDSELEVLARPELPVYGSLFHFRAGDKIYINAASDAYALLDTEDLSLGGALDTSKNFGYISSNAGRLLYDEQMAVCSFNEASGEGEELFKWFDVALRYSGLRGMKCFENSAGDFFYPFDSGLVKVSLGMKPLKHTLTLGCFGDESYEMYRYQEASYFCTPELMDAVIRFNNTDPEFRVEIKPLIYSTEAERDKLLIDLATGSGIDLLDTSLMPDRALDAGLLVDMLPYIDADESLSREDFIAPLLNAMMRDGGLYEYTDKFTILTMTTRQELFSARESWTAEAVESLIAKHPDMLVPSREQNLESILLAATAEFIEWESMTCSFDSPAFQGWLGLIKAMPERGMFWAGSPGSSTERPLFCISADLPFDAGFWSRNIFGGEYAVSGFPDAVGTGSYFMKLKDPLSNEITSVGSNTRIGIMASGENHEAAWRFVRTLMLGESEPSLAGGIPVFKESFEKAVDNAVTDRSLGWEGYDEFNAADAELLREQVYNSTKYVSTDEDLLSILRSEINAFLAGQNSAAETAERIQSRVSIYLSEQS